MKTTIVSTLRRVGLRMGVVVAVAATVMAGSVSVSQAAEVNVIPDAGLRQCLDQYMQDNVAGYKSDAKSISQADLDALAQTTNTDYIKNSNSLYCSGVASLSGLQNLRDPRLYKLSLYESSVTDFSVLAAMPNIWWLDVYDSSITTIPASIPKLTTIIRLGLYPPEFDTLQISDLTPLTRMTQLVNLSVEKSRVSDLTPLSNMTQLGYLDLKINQINDVSPLKNLTNLDYLDLYGNQISDVSPLKNMTKMEYLDLGDNQINDVSPLKNMTQLQHLDLFMNRIADLSPLPVSERLDGDLWGQTLTSSAKLGSTVSLPSVKTLSWDNPISWSVSQGDAIINTSKGTVTYNSPGEVILRWHGAATIDPLYDNSKDTCVQDGGIWLGQSGGSSPCMGSYLFVGTVTVTVPGCQKFTDVPSSNTFASSICWASATGITKGTGDGTTYSPSNPVNRGSMAAFLYRLAGSPKWDPPTTSPFVDVKTTDTFYPAITWLYSQGITVGTTVNGKVYYQPSNAVNRGSMSAFLYRFSASPKWTLPTTSPFADVAQTNTFYKSITWLADQKITVGSTSGGKLVYQPGNPVNRGSMAAFMQRLAKTELQCTRYGNAIGC